MAPDLATDGARHPTEQARYDELVAAIMPLYREGSYGEALALVRGAAPRLPQHRADTAHLAACLHALAGEPREAYDELRAAFEDGGWWHRHLLEDDPDLVTLRDLDGFTALVDASHQRCQRAQNGPMPDATVLRPDGPATAALVLLHGAGQTGPQAISRWPAAAESSVMIVAPTSSQLTTPNHRTWPDPAVAMRDIVVAVAEAGIPDGLPIVSAGFSAGGRQAMVWALTDESVAAQRFLVVCPALGGVTFDRGALAGAVARGVRGHVLVGAQDEAVGAVREACELLNDVGVRTTLDVVDGVAHDYPTDFDVRLTSALASLLDGA